jgi:hypothetical protein
LTQGVWRSFLARQRKNVPTHFHRRGKHGPRARRECCAILFYCLLLGTRKKTKKRPDNGL